MAKENQRARGARDLLPDDMVRFRFIETEFIKECTRWGYREVRTPTIEFLHLFTSAGTLTPSMLNKVYSFLDWDGWSGERVVLRPDGTIPVARLYLENFVSRKIAKLFYVTNVFSFESTGKENREKWQCGVEYIGSEDILSDVETILLALRIIKNLGINDVQVKLSHSGLIKSSLNSLNLGKEKYYKTLNEVNRGNWEYLSRIRGNDANSENLVALLFNIKGKTSSFLNNIKSLPRVSKEIKIAIDNFSSITKLLDSLKCRYQIDITSAQNFEYYTGLCFQVLCNNQIIVSGGRYNDLLPLMGVEKKPACGFALYLNRFMKFLTIDSSKTSPRIAILYSHRSLKVKKIAIDLATLLIRHGFNININSNKEVSDCKWIIEVSEKAPSFKIFEKHGKQILETSSQTKLINLLEPLN